MPQVDAQFLALSASVNTDAAINVALAHGATWCDVRVTQETSRYVELRDGKVDSAATDIVTGIGVRVIYKGAWGFAASSLVPGAEESCAQRAVAMAKATAALVSHPVTLAAEPPHTGTWVLPYLIDPTEVSDADVVDQLAQWSAQVSTAEVVDHTYATFQAAKEQIAYADSAGTRTVQQRVRCHPEVRAVAVGPAGFEDMSTTLPPRAMGWEYALDRAWASEINELAGHLSDRVAAPSLPAGRYDLVIAPSNLWLTIHESVGHATEFDRAQGYEANYAGTSFATPDGLGSLRYGSPLMHITGDRTAATGLATVAWDHEGVAAQEWDIVADGVLVGYQLDRWGAARMGAARSNGCAYADQATAVQLQRMPNVSLQPDAAGPSAEGLIAGVTDGLLVIGDKSWSIDMNRRNFQFTAQRFVRIRNGQLAGQVKDIAYQSDTLEFWGNLAALGGPDTYDLGGALNCGKGQPGQVAAVSHGCPAAVFTGVNVLTTKESG